MEVKTTNGDGVWLGKIGYPKREPRLSQFNGTAEERKERKEYGHLQEHRQASTDRIDFFLPIEPHHGLVHFLLVAGITLAKFGNFGLESLHLGSRFKALVRERENNDLDENRKKNDDHAVIWNQSMHGEEGFELKL